MSNGYNRNGGLTLVPMIGFELIAERIKQILEKERNFEVDIVLPEFGFRASGEPFLRLGKEHIGGHDCVILTSGPGTWEKIGQLQFLLSYIVGRSAQRISVVASYMPLSRSDKDEESQELALLNIFIHMIYSASYEKLHKIISVDLHSPQTVLANPKPGIITEVSMARILLKYSLTDALKTGKNIVIMFPDGGALDRFSGIIPKVEKELFEQMNINIKFPRVNGHKKRIDSNEVFIGHLDGDTHVFEDRSKPILVICFDDEVSTADTMNKTGSAICEKYGIDEFWGVVPHAIICGKAPTILAGVNCTIKKLYVTNTIPFTNRPHLQHLIDNNILYVYDWVKEMSKIIYFHHIDMNIREMR